MSTTVRPLRSPWFGEGLTSATRDESGRKSGANMTIYGFAGRDLSGRRGPRQTVMCRNDDARQARRSSLLQAIAPNQRIVARWPHPVALARRVRSPDVSGLVGQKKRRPGPVLPAARAARAGAAARATPHD